MKRDSIATIRVAIVEDDPHIRSYLGTSVEQEPDFELVGAADSVASGMLLLASQPDVLLVDLGLPDGCGLDLVKAASKECPDTEVAAITTFGDESHVLGALEAGATGYLLKDGTVDIILASIRELYAGGSPISPSIARHLLRRLREPSNPKPTEPEVGSRRSEFVAREPAAGADSAARSVALLTPRETTVLQQIAKGYSYDEISTALGISVHTVTTHIKHIYRKLAVRSRGEAVFEAMQLGLIKLEAHSE
ncbi:MAG: LuxR C-terminal-related transcriptional regulator [Burkholderiaceae bacterium]